MNALVKQNDKDCEQKSSLYSRYCSRITNEVIFDMAENPFFFVNRAIRIAYGMQKEESFIAQHRDVFNFSEKTLREIIKDPELRADVIKK